MELCGAEEVQADPEFRGVVPPSPKQRKKPRRKQPEGAGAPLGQEAARAEPPSAPGVKSRKRARVDARSGRQQPKKSKSKYHVEQSFVGRLVRLPSSFWGDEWAATQTQSDWLARPLSEAQVKYADTLKGSIIDVGERRQEFTLQLYIRL